MTTAMKISGVTACIALTIPLFANADTAPKLTNNPFSRPVSIVTNGIAVSVANAPTETAILDLKATLAFGDRGFANVAGRILRAGDEVNGYRLIEVQENYAVFERDQQLFTVYVKPHLVSDDDS